jgi:hypothetical protein
MNLSTSYLFQYFLELSVWGKVAVIAGYALLALLIILWEQSRARRHTATRLPTVIPNSVIEPTEKFVHTSPTSTRKENQYNPHKGARYLLEMFRSSLSKCVVYCESHNTREKHLKYLQQYIPKHIHTILDFLRRRVNQSGKEPSFG